MNDTSQGELVILSLGSNVGDSALILSQAIDRLRELAVSPVRFSSVWETTPVDCPPGSPRFLNAVATFASRTGETPESLLRQLQSIEREFGRQTKVILNEPRPLDLDLIAFGPARRASPDLILPHPRATMRQFVLQPLQELLPDLVLPGQTQTVTELLGNLEPDPNFRRLSSQG